MVPAAAILAFFFFGIEELAVQLEEPFSILPLTIITNGSIFVRVQEFGAYHDVTESEKNNALEDMNAEKIMMKQVVEAERMMMQEVEDFDRNMKSLMKETNEISKEVSISDAVDEDELDKLKMAWRIPLK